MNQRIRIILILLIISVAIVLDQITKTIAVNTLKFNAAIAFWGDFFVLRYAENTGAMLGFGSELPGYLRFWLLTVAVGLLLAVLVVYIFWNRNLTRVQTIALTLIAGGGISNFIDRLLNDGRVVDFMHMGFGDLRTGIFNVADVFIMSGLALMLIFGEWRDKSENAPEIRPVDDAEPEPSANSDIPAGKAPEQESDKPL
ncbi:MAG: signal peptidase II [Calditrichaeota bacterium]|nr:signal peptidase II [Calditrichota bacterium]